MQIHMEKIEYDTHHMAVGTTQAPMLQRKKRLHFSSSHPCSCLTQGLNSKCGIIPKHRHSRRGAVAVEVAVTKTIKRDTVVMTNIAMENGYL